MPRPRLRTAVALVLAAAALGATSPAASAAPRAHGDRAAIEAALARAGLPAAERHAARVQVRRAFVLAGRLGGERRTELRAVLRSAALIARRTGYDASRARGVVAEIAANRSWAARRPLPPVSSRHWIGDLLFQRYAGEGLRIMPLLTYWYADDWIHHGDRVRGLRVLDAALAVAGRRNGRIEVEYLFPFGGGQPPWRSAMASSTAMAASLSAWERTADPARLADARSLLTDVLGGARRVPGGRWFPLYRFAPDGRILNGHLKVLVGLGRMATAGADPRAQAAMDEGLAATRQVLRRYDTGGWSRYDPWRDAPLEYHDLQTDLLRLLARRTGDATVAEYARRFEAYRTRPVRLEGPGAPPAALYPVPRDGHRDETDFALGLTKPARVVLAVRDAAGRLVDRVDLGALGTGTQRARFRPPAAEGAYRIDATAVDVTGGRTVLRGLTTLTVARDRTPPAVTLTLRGRVLAWRARDAETPWIDLRLVTPNGSRIGLRGRALRGAHRLAAAPRRLVVTVRDSAGNGVRVTVARGRTVTAGP